MRDREGVVDMASAEEELARGTAVLGEAGCRYESAVCIMKNTQPRATEQQALASHLLT